MGSNSGPPQGDELDVLVPLVEAYEPEHDPIDLSTPLDFIKFRLEQQGKDYRAFIGVIGARTRVYEAMRSARPLSLNMIRKLHTKLGIPADVLIPAPPPPKQRSKSAPAQRNRRQKRARAIGQAI